MAKTETEVVDRRARRRSQTRSQLLEAAKELFARQGVDATRIQEITDEADVGFGSFYNHFEDKDAIVDAVLRDTTDFQAQALDALRPAIEDPAEVVAVAHRHFVLLAESNPAWAWLVIRLDVSHRIFTETLGPRAVRDIELGVAAGRFEVDDVAFAATTSGGALLATVRTVLEGGAPADAPERHAEVVLRMLGVPPAEAAEVARRPLPG